MRFRIPLATSVRMRAILLSAILSFAGTALAAPPTKAAKFISEKLLREVVAQDADFANTYMIEFLNQLQACGFQGQILRIMDHPQLVIPEVRGLYFLVRNVDPIRGCVSKHWHGLDSLAVRQQIRRLAQSNTTVLIALQSFWPFHSAYFDGQTSPYARELADVTGRETPSDRLFLLGRPFLFEYVDEDEARPLALDMLKIANFDVPGSLTLVLMELVARANRAEIQNEQAPTMLEIRSHRFTRWPAPARKTDLKAVIEEISRTRLSLSVRRQVADILKRQLHAKDFSFIGPHLGLPGCSDLLN